MLRVAVFCGGTGSIALQNGFASLYGIDRVQMDIIVNAYDNGKSTGVCRRCFNNEILGPSDVRKNQLLQYSIQNESSIKDGNNREARLFEMFNVRLSADCSEAYYRAAKSYMEDFADVFDSDTLDYLSELLDFFFFESDANGNIVQRRTTIDEDYSDFALSNIFYASCAAKCGNSLEKAMDCMARILGIKDTVHLISDKSLLLKAETQSGHIIEDEGDIVTWDNPDDQIIRAILMDGESEYIPVVGEDSAHTDRTILQIVDEADIIIFSSGTQWSSLIPTYMHKGFREMIANASANKYLIMNNEEDHDTYGVSAEEMCDILTRYLDMDQITVVLNKEASVGMQALSERYHSICGMIGSTDSSKHDPVKLVGVIMSDYYREALSCTHQFFDLDGTLWEENGTDEEKELGRENLALFQGAVLTGNSVAHVQSVFEHNLPMGKDLKIFADYGNTMLQSSDFGTATKLTDRYLLPESLLHCVKELSVFAGKQVFLRGGVVLTIKPLKGRKEIIKLLRQELSDYEGLSIELAGRTSIDIMYSDYSKATMLRLIMEQGGMPMEKTLFIGNELEEGSETGVADMPIHTLPVHDIYDTYVYLRTREVLPYLSIN